MGPYINTVFDFLTSRIGDPFTDDRIWKAEVQRSRCLMFAFTAAVGQARLLYGERILEQRWSSTPKRKRRDAAPTLASNGVDRKSTCKRRCKRTPRANSEPCHPNHQNAQKRKDPSPSMRRP